MLLKKAKCFLIPLFILVIINNDILGVSDYKVGPKDVIEITVFQLDELNVTVRVSESGYITLPLLGKIDVKGLTSEEIEKKLVLLLKERYLQDPQVSIFIKEFMSRRAYIIGAVSKPGPYEIIGQNTILQIIAMSGGFTDSVAGDTILVNRGTSLIKIQIQDLLESFKAESNIEIIQNDLIIVPQLRDRFIYIMGQVRTPGTISIKKSEGMTLLEVIAQAGGFTDKASKSNVIVHRKVNGQIKIFRFNVKDILFGKGKAKDFQVQENDIIFVKESIF